MKKLNLALLFLLLSHIGLSQQRMIIYFQNKCDDKVVSLTDRSIQRREKNNVVTDSRDIPVCPDYLRQLSNSGRILNTSRWLNAVTIETFVTPADLKNKFPFISEIKEIEAGTGTVKKFNMDYVAPKSLNYGVADTQVRQIGADCLHDQGFTGEGIFLAIIDAGFRGMDTISYFDSLYLENRLIDMYDFVNGTGVYDYSGHGTAVASCILAEKSGTINYAGTAVDLDIALYVSEDVSSETLIEEFNLVSALERCDSMGVDLATISLGYTVFDNSADDHTYWDMNGQTTIAAQGINTAVSKGILVLAAAGNEGPSFISTPCDADSSICVGAVDNAGTYADFSSVGPNSDGQVKPDVMATGKNTWVIIEDGSLVMGNGTSFATPVMAGAVACLIQANPQRTVAEIQNAIRQSASQFSNPNGYMGYGIPDLCEANDSLTLLGLTSPFTTDIIVYPNPADQMILLKGKSDEISGILIVNVLGDIVFQTSTFVSSISTSHMMEGVYFVLIETEGGSFCQKLVIRH